MITDGLLKFLLSIVSSLWALLPPWTISVGPEAGFYGSYLKGFNNYAPVTELFAVVGWTLALFIAMHGFKWILKVIDWIADVIP